MKVCRICGESKEDKYFHKPKFFTSLYSIHHVWCRVCMKLYMQMKEQEKIISTFQEYQNLHIVSFD